MCREILKVIADVPSLFLCLNNSWIEFVPETPVEFLFPGTDTTPRIDCNPRLLVSFITELATLCLYIMRFFLDPVANPAN